MSLQIPLRNDLDAFEERVTLDGVDYDLAFRWNERDLQWYFSIYATDSPQLTDGSRAAVLAGMPLLVGWPLLSTLSGRDRPAGELLALDTSGADAEAGQRDLGARVIVIYTPQAELPEPS